MLPVQASTPAPKDLLKAKLSDTLTPLRNSRDTRLSVLMVKLVLLHSTKGDQVKCRPARKGKCVSDLFSKPHRGKECNRVKGLRSVHLAKGKVVRLKEISPLATGRPNPEATLHSQESVNNRFNLNDHSNLSGGLHQETKPGSRDNPKIKGALCSLLNKDLKTLHNQQKKKQVHGITLD